jgi:nucleoside phosphorylase
VAETGDQFGASVAGANFGKSSHADLAVGVVSEDVGAVMDAGAVNVLYGSSAGLTATGDQFFHQDSSGVKDAAEADDEFGISLAGANFGKSSHADLAVGVIFEDVGALTNAGAVNVLYGSSAGLTATGDQFWHQDSTGVNDTAEEFDSLGFSLAGANFGKSSHADLAVGVFEEDVGAVGDAGAVNVLYGTSAGLTATGDQFFHQDSAGVLDAAEAGDEFSTSLAPRR